MIKYLVLIVFFIIAWNRFLETEDRVWLEIATLQMLMICYGVYEELENKYK
jgi:hypothetical protein